MAAPAGRAPGSGAENHARGNGRGRGPLRRGRHRRHHATQARALMPLASLKLEVQGPVVYAQVSGDIDMSNATDLRQEISRMTPNDALGLILDLREVRYMDSAGIHALHHLREDLGAGGQKM